SRSGSRCAATSGTTSSSTQTTPNESRSTPVHSPYFSKMGTLKGFPNPPAMSSARQSRASLDAIKIFFILATLLVGGCSISKWTVKPHQRELLADRIMQLDADAQERAAEEHVLANREGAIGGTGTSGGGCGCN